MTIVCPQCTKSDMIQKVSAVYRGGKAYGSYGGNISFAGTSQTLLSEKLAPPVRPRYRGSGMEQLVSFGAIAILTVITNSILAPQFGGSNCLTIYFSLIIAVIIWAGYFWWKKLTFDSEQRPIWDRKMEVWNRLYYCARDDCAFDPINQRTMPVENLPQLY